MKKILVIGDSCKDIFIYGKANRLCPEAPVPVFIPQRRTETGGMAANVYENIDRDGRAQTKILDGVLIQIALKELRDKYPNKYVAVRSTRDGLKFIIE